MPKLTADQLEAAARAAEEEAIALDLQAAALREHARLLREAAGNAPLTMRRNRSMVGSNMEASDLAGKPENVRTSANRARRQSAARDAMIASNHVAADLAKVCKVGRSTMNAYLNGTRPVPPEVKAKLAPAPYLIPPSSWPKSA